MLFPLLTVEGLPALAVAVVVLLPAIFWLYLAAGLIAWRRRPRSAVGPLLLWTGVAVWIIGAGNTAVPAFAVLVVVFPTLVFASLVHLLLAFPSGRLSSPLDRGIVVAMYGAAVVLRAPLYLFDPAATPPPAPSLAIADIPAAVTVGGWTQILTILALSAAAAAVLGRRLTRAVPGQRRLLWPLYTYGAAVVLFVPAIALAFAQWWPGHSLILNSIQVLSIALMPFAVLGVFLAGGFRATAELEALGSWLAESEGARPPIETALADALGDPTLAVTYWSDELREWVSADGLAAPRGERGELDGDRARYELRLGGIPVVAVDYDRTASRDARDVERAASLVALALERERLTAELLASRQAVVASRERIAAAADVERRRISRGLHDGLQARLLLLGIDASRIASAPASEVAARAIALRDDADQAAAELRAFVHDLVPPALIELGVVGAVEELVESMPIPTRLDAPSPGRLDDGVETTAYLVVAEALSNVVKHSGATRCTVTLRADADGLHIAVADDGNGQVRPDAGTGLAGIADRVSASGGASGFRTPPEGGTVVWARIPFE